MVAEIDPATRYTLRRNTASIKKIGLKSLNKSAFRFVRALTAL